MSDFDMILNMSRTSERGVLLKAISALRGPVRITIKSAARVRSLAQNRLYWGVYVPALRNHLMKQGEVYSPEALHAMLKDRFLRQPIVIENSGELLGYNTRSTTELTVIEFNEFLDRVGQWYAETFGIVLPSIEEFDQPAVPAGGARE